MSRLSWLRASKGKQYPAAHLSPESPSSGSCGCGKVGLDMTRLAGFFVTKVASFLGDPATKQDREMTWAHGLYPPLISPKNYHSHDLLELVMTSTLACQNLI